MDRSLFDDWTHPQFWTNWNQYKLNSDDDVGDDDEDDEDDDVDGDEDDDDDYKDDEADFFSQIFSIFCISKSWPKNSRII